MGQENTGTVFVTAPEKAYRIISGKILNGELKPGDKLSKRQMAKLTGVSVIPVIDALNQLEQDGLVESKPQWGSFVTIPTPEKIKDNYMLREAIECHVARILAQNMTDYQEQELRRIAEELDSIPYNNDNHDKINKLHYEFHSKLTECTGYSSLIDTLRKANLFWLLYIGVISRRKKSQVPRDWHMRLIDTIANRDADKAEAVMRIHIYDSIDSILGDLEQV